MDNTNSPLLSYTTVRGFNSKTLAYMQIRHSTTMEIPLRFSHGGFEGNVKSKLNSK